MNVGFYNFFNYTIVKVHTLLLRLLLLLLLATTSINVTMYYTTTTVLGYIKYV
jgi:hypothetical protein